jgi:hypothetical protein
LQFTSKGHVQKHQDENILARAAPKRKSLPSLLPFRGGDSADTAGAPTRRTVPGLLQRQSSDDGSGTDHAFSKRFSFSLPSLDASRLRRPLLGGAGGAGAAGAAAAGQKSPDKKGTNKIEDDIRKAIANASPSGKKLMQKLDNSDRISGNTGVLDDLGASRVAM